MAHTDTNSPGSNEDDDLFLQKAESLFLQGKPKEAQELCSRVIMKNPTNAAAYNLLGQIHYQTHNFVLAKELFLTATALEPGNPLIHRNLAFTLDSLGEREAAVEAFRKTLAEDPADTIAHLNLGIILKELASQDQNQKLLNQAYQHLEKCALLRKTDATALAELADALTLMQQHQKAMEYAKAACTLHSDNPRALSVYAKALMNISKPQQAIEIAERLTEIAPNDAESYQILGYALLESGFANKALTNANLSLNLSPDNMHSLRLAATARVEIGDWNNALAIINQALEHYPDEVSLLNVKANILHRMGDKKAAFTIVKRLIGDVTSMDPFAFHLYLKLAPDNGEYKKARKLLKVVLNNQGIASSLQTQLYFHAGEFYANAKEYDKAFSCYQQANSLKPREYDKEMTERIFTMTKRHVTEELFTPAHLSGNNSRKPIFIVGMPRSGTSLTEKILASHSSVYGAGELGKIQNLARESIPRLTGATDDYPVSMPLVTSEIANQLAEEYLEHIGKLSPEGVAHVVDKMPHNFFHVGLIKLIFPQAKIIHCKRNPVDTALSLYFQNFAASGLQYAYDLKNIGHFYCLHEDLMDYWYNLFPGQIYTVNYEELVSRPEPRIRSLLEYCELEWEDACLSHHRAKEYTTTASFDQVRQPIYTKSVNKWKRYEKHLGPLLNELKNCNIAITQ